MRQAIYDDDLDGRYYVPAIILYQIARRSMYREDVYALLAETTASRSWAETTMIIARALARRGVMTYNEAQDIIRPHIRGMVWR